MGLTALTMFSVGSILGTGIFVILGVAVPQAGPAIIVSFLLAGITCAFSALSYAEMAGVNTLTSSPISLVSTCLLLSCSHRAKAELSTFRRWLS